MEKITKVIIVDDHPLVLQGFEYLLKGIKELELAGAFTNRSDCLECLTHKLVDIVLLDINLPGDSGIRLCQDIKKKYPDIKIIGISNHSEREVILKMLQSGASGYILKNASLEELRHCIHESLNSGLALSPDARDILAQAHAGQHDRSVPRLTKREKEILQLISEGYTTQYIADLLFISPSTVESHRYNLMQKFEVSNAAALIRRATELNML